MSWRSIPKTLLLVSFLFLKFIYSQDKLDTKDYLDWFDNQIGKGNIALLNGKQYFDEDKSVLFENRHAYFLKDKFIKGNVIYNNQPYYNINLHYNIAIDELILNLIVDDRSLVFQLIKDNIQSFTIGEHEFLNLDKLSTSNDFLALGFVELLYKKENLLLIKKYKKSRRTKIKQSGRQRHSFVYFIQKSSYMVIKGDKLYEADSKSELIEAFPLLKNDIKEFFKNNWKLNNSYPDIFMENLFEKLSTLNQVVID